MAPAHPHATGVAVYPALFLLPIPTYEKPFFYWVFVQIAQVYHFVKFDPISDRPSFITLKIVENG